MLQTRVPGPAVPFIQCLRDPFASRGGSVNLFCRKRTHAVVREFRLPESPLSGLSVARLVTQYSRATLLSEVL